MVLMMNKKLKISILALYTLFLISTVRADDNIAVESNIIPESTVSENDRSKRILPFAGMTYLSDVPPELFFEFIDLIDNQTITNMVHSYREKGLVDEAIIELLKGDFDIIIALEGALIALSAEASLIIKAAAWEKKKRIFKYLLGAAIVGTLTWYGCVFAHKKYLEYGENKRRNEEVAAISKLYDNKGCLIVHMPISDNKSMSFVGGPAQVSEACNTCFANPDKFHLPCGHASTCVDCLRAQLDNIHHDNDLNQLVCSQVLQDGTICRHPIDLTRFDYAPIAPANSELFKRIERLLSQRAKLLLGVRNCHTPDCKGEYEIGNRMVNCKGCNTSYCGLCTKNHPLMTCKDAKIAELRTKAEDQKAAVQNAKWIQENTRPCPRCLVNIEKNAGCKHMTCKQAGCGYEFCWLCGCDWRASDGAGHFCLSRKWW